MAHSDDRFFSPASISLSEADHEAQLSDGQDKPMLEALRQQRLMHQAQAIIDVQKLLHGEAPGEQD